MRSFLRYVKTIAKQNPKRIVLPEGFEPRVLKATEIVIKEKTAHPILY
jgi:phosphotransacetylase